MTAEVAALGATDLLAVVAVFYTVLAVVLVKRMWNR